VIGQTISQYKILEKLGEGGMGVVYKAQDTKLDRIVALKFLPHHLSANEAEQARFLQEARAASSLNHPNVCIIYDIKEENDLQFIVMEYVDGATLRKRVPIQKIDDALTYAVQIGDALLDAHAHGIVHRDIKCENIMVNSKNQIKVMDFGLAKLKGSLKLTRTSSTVGTLAYMAPEQIQGGEVDSRSDIFSFGVVVFEMLTGRLPFAGEHEAAMMYSIVNQEPESVQKSRPDVSAEVDRIIRRALEKDPEDRYQHIDDMVSELRRLLKQSSRVSRTVMRDVPAAPTLMPSESGAPPTQEIGRGPSTATISSPASSRTRQFIIGVAVLLVLAACAVAYFSFLGKSVTIDSIAVLPFENVGADPNTEYLSDGMTESLINSLSQISNLTVMSRSSVFHYKGRDIDPQKAGKELGVKAVLTGRVTQRGDDLQISAELVNVANNSHIWGEQYNKKLADILSVQGEISKEISENLSLKLAGEDQKKLEKPATENSEAYQLYLKGRFYWNKRKADDLITAVSYFNQAIDKDPNYALAYAGLASVYVITPEYAGLPPKEWIPKAETAANKALELDPSLAEAQAVLGTAKVDYDWNWKEAEREYQRAIELNPNYPTTYHWYSILLNSERRFDEAYAKIKRAQELDPLSLVINLNVAIELRAQQRNDEAYAQLRHTLELDSNYTGAIMSLGVYEAMDGKFDDGILQLEKLRRIVGAKSTYGLGQTGYVYALAGKKEQALATINQLLEAENAGYSVEVSIASIYTGLHDIDNAFHWLDRAYEAHAIGMRTIYASPAWEPLSSDPRYPVLLKKIGLEK
jgi:serine/threonine-protein kinase